MCIRDRIKTAIENKQNLIIEGCYIPFDWANAFAKEYLDNIKYYCLVMSERYIKNNFDSCLLYTSREEEPDRTELKISDAYSKKYSQDVYKRQGLCQRDQPAGILQQGGSDSLYLAVRAKQVHSCLGDGAWAGNLYPHNRRRYNHRFWENVSGRSGTSAAAYNKD